jgi:hypothetical protein
MSPQKISLARSQTVNSTSPASADVLEVGRGNGFTAFKLAPHVRSITLLNVAPRSIEELRQPLWDQPQVYEPAWAFRHRLPLRLGGDIFGAAPVGGRPLGRLVVRAKK